MEQVIKDLIIIVKGLDKADQDKCNELLTKVEAEIQRKKELQKRMEAIHEEINENIEISREAEKTKLDILEETFLKLCKDVSDHLLLLDKHYPIPIENKKSKKGEVN